MQIGSSKKEKWPSHFLDPSNKFPEPPLHLVSIGHNIFFFFFFMQLILQKRMQNVICQKERNKKQKKTNEIIEE